MILASIFGFSLLLKNLMFLLLSLNLNPWLKTSLIDPLNPFKLMEGENSLSYKNSSPLMASLIAKHASTPPIKMAVLSVNTVKLWTLALPSLLTLMFHLFIGTQPLKPLFHKSPDYKFLKVFGCECWPYLRPYNSHKFSFRSKPCVFIGYSLSHHGYKCLDPLTNWVYIARHVVFNEQVFPFQKSPSHTEPSPSSLSGLLPLPSISLPQNSYNPCLFTHAPRSSSSPTRVMSYFFSHPPAS